jgi:hypothetical protein
MKKLIGGMILMVASSTAMAVAPGGPNCGWGNMLFEGKSGLGSHFLASTTNATSYNAIFGMTTGTNGCSVSEPLTYGSEEMVSAVMDELSSDVAQGHGEALNAVAVSMGIEAGDRAEFAKVAHENFAVIFPSENVTAKEVVASLTGVMKTNSRLTKYTV